MWASYVHYCTPRMHLQLRGTCALKNAQPLVLTMSSAWLLNPLAIKFNGQKLLWWKMKKKNPNQTTKRRLCFLQHFLTKSLFLGLSRGFHFSSGSKGAPFVSPLTASIAYSPRSTTFHMSKRWTDYLQEGQRTSPTELSPPPKKAMQSSSGNHSSMARKICLLQIKSVYHELSRFCANVLGSK